MVGLKLQVVVGGAGALARPLGRLGLALEALHGVRRAEQSVRDPRRHLLVRVPHDSQELALPQVRTVIPTLESDFGASAWLGAGSGVRWSQLPLSRSLPACTWNMSMNYGISPCD